MTILLTFAGLIALLAVIFGRRSGPVAEQSVHNGSPDFDHHDDDVHHHQHQYYSDDDDGF